MAINPMKLLELKNLWSAFTRRHPKFPQFLSAVLSLLVGVKNFPVLHLHREDFSDLKGAIVLHFLATVGLSGAIGYTAVCIASPLAWFGACALLIPCYYKMMKGEPAGN